MAKTSPAQFVRQVQQEMRKVTWPSRRETTLTTMMVLIMVGLTAVFLMLVDLVLAYGVQWVLGLGG
ncbi:MAG: preprotein translocase subunit SecE [Alphaproteobacteria bacterium]|nr:MAG: preprotein translocase subunit SecE [Alphaproteobacteria bacterium]